MMTRRDAFTGAAIAFAIGILASCGGGGGTIVASSFDQSCSKASDCVGVFQGTPACCDIECPNVAINIKDRSRYEVALSADAPTNCPPTACVAMSCLPTSVACVAGQCSIGFARTFDGGRGG
jgi:hypothetical protein